MGIVVIGAVFVDIKGYPFGNYIPGGRNAGRIEQVHGGVSRNIAEDIANVGLKPSFLSVVDESGIGADVIERLQKSRVDTTYIRRVPDGLGTWLAVFDSSGEVAAAISKRPDLSEIIRILDEKGDEIFADCDSIVLEIDMDPEIVARTFHYAEKYGKKIYAAVANMTIASERYDYIRRTDCFVCNRQEAGILFHVDAEKMEVSELQKELTSRAKEAGLRKLIVTMGGEGAICLDSEGNSAWVPVALAEVVDTTGAGDAFLAGVVIGLTYGKNLQESAVIGTKLAASVIGTAENVCPIFRKEELGVDVS